MCTAVAPEDPEFVAFLPVEYQYAANAADTKQFKTISHSGICYAGGS